MEAMGEDQFDTLLKEKLTGDDYSAAYDEVIADSCEMLLRDSKTLEKIARENASLFVKIKEAVQSFIDKLKKALKEAYGDTGELHSAAEALKLSLSDMTEIQQLFDDVLYKSISNMKNALAEAENAKTRENLTVLENAAEKEAKNTYTSISFSDESTKNDSKYIINCISDNLKKIPDSTIFNVKSEAVTGRVSDYINEIFVSQNNIAHNSKIGAVELGKSGAKSTTFHGYGKNKLAAAKAIKPTIENGVILTKKENYRNTGVDRYIIAAKGEIDGNDAYIGVMVKAYPNRNSKSKFYLHEATIIEANSHIMTAAHESGSTVSESASTYRISETEQNVKTKLNSVTESLQFKRWFGDWQNNPKKASKVINKDGTPRVVYYETKSESGTSATGTNAKGRGLISEGMLLFTSQKGSYTGANPKIEECYLCIKNPLYIDSRGYYYANEYYDRHAESINLDYLTGDYDGIIIENSDKSAYPTVLYLVDNPAQVKSATDNLGTFDKSESDIRYSEETNLDEKFSYDNLVRKPDMNVIQLSDQIPSERNEIVKRAKENAKSVGRANRDGSVSVHVSDSNTDVVLSTKGLIHGLDRRIGELAPITVSAGEIIKNSILINELTPAKENADASYILLGAASNAKGNIYIVRSVINRHSNELSTMDVLYALNAKKSTAALNAPLVSTPNYRTTISIADLLQIVNSYFPDVLPESVLRHFGYDSRPEGILGESALYSEETNGTDPHSILLADMEMTAKTQTEKNFVEKYRENVEKVVELETELEYLNSEIKEISFTKGSDRSRLASLNAQKKAVLYQINLFDSKLTEYRGYKVFQNMIDRKKAKQKTYLSEKFNKKLESVKAEERERSNNIKRELLDKAIELAERRRKKDVMSDIAKRLTEIDRLASSATRHKHLPSATVELVARMRMPISVDF